MQHLRTAMTGIGCLLVFTTALLGADAGAVAKQQENGQLSPITRVVQLLEGMSARIEADHKAEEDLYENFVCWATSIISQKEASNAAAQSRVDSLTTYISQLTSGQIELTTERVDTQKKLDSLLSDIGVADQMRQQENRDFRMAKQEIDAAIAALTAALAVLNTATQNHTQGVLVSIKSSLAESGQIRAQEATALNRAVELGNRVLTRGDSLFLQRLLTGDIPDRADWKTLNRKATFKMSYKARSFKIQSVLAKLMETFAQNQQDAVNKELQRVTEHNLLMGTKLQEKQATEQALQDLNLEKAARQQSLGEKTQEKNDLGLQINDDTGYIAQVRQSLANKKNEWKNRQQLRTDELAAIAQAIAILHSDDARDLFKKSFASQGFLLQVGAEQQSHRSRSAAVVLLAAARKSHDKRLEKVAATLQSNSGNQIAAVITAIDNMLTLLRNEETTDLSDKENCETNRQTETRNAIKTSREMDELTETIRVKEADIAERKSEIEEKTAQVSEIVVELGRIFDMRDAENKEFLKSKQDDEDAKTLVDQARVVLSNFYTSNNLMLVQGKHGQKGKTDRAPFVSQAGAAPPPPPQTWATPGYQGKVPEAKGILAILDMIHDDIAKDITKATNDEAAALALYTTTKTNLDNEKLRLNTRIGVLQGEVGNLSTEKQQAMTGRDSKFNILQPILANIRAAEPNCDFIAINFHARSENRKIEIDGLEKAKAILSGATFDLPDPNRELRPGDAALVQHKTVARSKFLQRQ